MVIFFATSSISVVTGSTSLVTVPAMFQFHIDPRTAVATNMFALTFMSIGGALPFLKGQNVDRKRLPTLISFTLVGSLIGAFLLLLIPSRSVPIVVSVAVLAVAVFALIYRKSGVERSTIPSSPGAELVGYLFYISARNIRRILQRRLHNDSHCGLRRVLPLVIPGSNCNYKANKRLFLCRRNGCLYVARPR
jgi:uncharacterized membrane protein YfcA